MHYSIDPRMNTAKMKTKNHDGTMPQNTYALKHAK